VPVLTANFPVGTTGTIDFVCPFYLFDSDGNEIQAPFTEQMVVNGTVETVTLLSGVDPDVVPNPWSYTVKINLNGANEFIAYVEMPLTDADFMDVFNPTQPSTPEYYVLKSDYLAHVDEGGPGGGATQEDIDDAISAHEAEANPHPVYLTQAEADALYEDTGAVAAHEAAGNPHPVYETSTEVDAKITTHSGATDPHGDRAFATAAVGVETTARIADVDAEETRALAAEALKANIASPTFTGNPQAPTPTGGDNDTSIATTAFVQAAITTAVNALIDGAPGALDTLNELAAALNDDASFHATVTTALSAKINASILTNDGDMLTRVAGAVVRITRASLAADTAWSSVYETIANVALKANIASPTFTGTPAAPTAAQGTNTTQLATTAYVQTEAGLLVPKSLADAKGDLIIATGSDTFAKHTVGANGTFLVANSANSDGWENRVLAYTDLPVLPKGTMSVGTKVVSNTTDTIMGLTADTNPGVTVSQTHAFHSDSTNRSRMTIPSGLDGDYLCFFAFNLGGTDSGGSRRARLLKNGSTLATLLSPDAPAAIAAIETTAYYAVGLAAGDYLEVQVYQDSGGALNFTMSSFTIIRFP
jgi:hypothetical protein